MPKQTYLVFGDLHGRILPAFRLAAVWSREHDVPLAGLLQVGDLGYFPDLSRLDKATVRYAKDDPTELGAQDIVNPNPLADQIFDDPHTPAGLWFTAGNHEDHEVLDWIGEGCGSESDFVIDEYRRVRCIRDGDVVEMADGLRVAALWGVDGEGPNCRKRLTERAYINSRSVNGLLHKSFDVLLTHDSPADAKRIGYGSEGIALVIQLSVPRFAFFGHYHGTGSRIEGDFGATVVCHLSGFELGGRNGHAEFGSVGALTWDGDTGHFEFLDKEWLQSFTRDNWKWR